MVVFFALLNASVLERSFQLVSEQMAVEVGPGFPAVARQAVLLLQANSFLQLEVV